MPRPRRKVGTHGWKAKERALTIVCGNRKPVCAGCGNEDLRVLSINHKNWDGYKDRKNGGDRLYWDIIKGRRKVEDLDCRCYNCQALYEYGDRGGKIDEV